MNFQLALFAVAAAFLSSAQAADSPVDHRAMFKRWEKALEPTLSSAESIGSYSAGCLAGGEKLEIDGKGYSVMRLSRLRNFGHPDLVAYLKELGEKTNRAGLPRILIGDLGRPRGGPMISGHASHQSGLDVDIWYDSARKKPTRREREKRGASSYVNRDGSIKKSWTDKHRLLLELAASSDFVDRIFVHAGIKRDLCERMPDAPWLAKLRPWWGHDDHLHVRLKCPAGSTLCEAQEPVANLGPQCGKELDWWFSAEAREEWGKRKGSIGREFPALPVACNSVLNEMHADKGGNP
jgi:penicillin-insensitive murein endopeptidase